MKAINITKFNNRTEHFYVSFWNISSYVDIETIKSGYLTLHDNVFSNMGKDSNIFIPIKSTDEKNLMKKVKTLLNEYCRMSANIILVFKDEIFSESETNYILSI